MQKKIMLLLTQNTDQGRVFLSRIWPQKANGAGGNFRKGRGTLEPFILPMTPHNRLRMLRR